jgi:hypothetical protein
MVASVSGDRAAANHESPCAGADLPARQADAAIGPGPDSDLEYPMRLPFRSAALLLSLGLACPASAQTVYTWKDANGVTHASDNPPPGQRYQARRVTGHGQSVVETDPAAPENEQCRTARANLALLAGSGPVLTDSDGDGKPDRPLEAQERAGQKGLAEAAVKAYCPPAG